MLFPFIVRMFIADPKVVLKSPRGIFAIIKKFDDHRFGNFAEKRELVLVIKTIRSRKP